MEEYELADSQDAEIDRGSESFSESETDGESEADSSANISISECSSFFQDGSDETLDLYNINYENSDTETTSSEESSTSRKRRRYISYQC